MVGKNIYLGIYSFSKDRFSGDTTMTFDLSLHHMIIEQASEKMLPFWGSLSSECPLEDMFYHKPA